MMVASPEAENDHNDDVATADSDAIQIEAVLAPLLAQMDPAEDCTILKDIETSTQRLAAVRKAQLDDEINALKKLSRELDAAKRAKETADAARVVNHSAHLAKVAMLDGVYMTTGVLEDHKFSIVKKIHEDEKTVSGLDGRRRALLAELEELTLAEKAEANTPPDESVLKLAMYKNLGIDLVYEGERVVRCLVRSVNNKDIVPLEMENSSNSSKKRGLQQGDAPDIYSHTDSSKKLPHSVAPNDAAVDTQDIGPFEDNWVDEIEDDEEDGDVIIDNDDDDADGDNADSDVQMEQDNDDPPMRVYMPGDELQDGEVLVADNSAYEMLHQMNVEWPCLSFDVLRDQLGSGRKHFPMTAYIVAGSQAERAKDNKIYVMKMSDLHRTKHDNDDEMDEDSGDEDLDDDPVLEFKTVPHNGGVNRVRAMQHPDSHIVATWSEYGKVYLWDLTSVVASLDTPGTVAAPNSVKPLHTVDRHNKAEGFAMDWSSLNNKYRLLSGDVNGKIYLTTLHSNTAFQTDAQAFTGHQSSVEDLQWSPAEDSVFASCSADGTIRIWDVRTRSKAQLAWKAHSTDVNVITWNRLTDRLLASGSDSGEFSVWDFRTVSSSVMSQQQTAPSSSKSVNATATPAATFSWHKKPVTSIEWHSAESSVLAVSAADDQVTLWDLALERDAEEEPILASGAAGNGVEVPPQLLFIHQGQEMVKEIHWHPQCPGVLVSTALSGFNIFKTINS
ncbi:ribosome biosynthesis protein rrb1 [Entophlyctis sp. JEL0112]|nr:ribosome biosynthesis protein rrb1 [Entophlyctis sp. JEL0112]